MDEAINTINTLLQADAGRLILVFFIMVLALLWYMERGRRASHRDNAAFNAQLLKYNADMVKVIQAQQVTADKQGDAQVVTGRAMEEQTRQSKLVTKAITDQTAQSAQTAAELRTFTNRVETQHAALQLLCESMVGAQVELSAMISRLIAMVQELQSSQENDTDIKDRLSNYGQQLLNLSELLQVMKVSIDALSRSEPKPIS